MIGSLRGSLAELEASAGEQALDAVVDVGGVGYRVVLGARTAAALGPVGSPVALSVHTHVREGAITLYGFSASEDRRTFELLIGAHGVGPALAMAILGVHGPVALARIVAAGDVDALTLVPGVGKKTAQRLVIELAQRLDTVAPGPAAAGAGAAPGRPRAEVAEALGSLGYAHDEVRAALERLPEEGTVEELLREALRELAPRA
ncbi:MAG TPA: Holliday junction branch migration protein RuvA [Acidimicrobiales bacterium]|nr:Holliday junction branch migration protein RuvA [Acidimicrobiales bacterium]